jgi:tRNA (guanine37-N1)-methyltransferase
VKSAMKHLDDERLSHLTKGVDIVGDIAILRLPAEFRDERRQIAYSLLELTPNLKVVLEQSSPVSSRFRTRRLEWLAGEHRTDTVHSEYGCKYRINLETTYFSPRLGRERKRVADLVADGECVVNFFAGVGSFSIMIAKHSHPSKIYSLDINRSAVRYHAMNNGLNRVKNKIEVICGDARQLVSASLQKCADRVLLPLPELALEALPIAKSALKNEHGIVHCYVFIDSNSKSDAGDKALTEFGPAFREMGISKKNAEAHVVRSVGPCRYQICLDICV